MAKDVQFKVTIDDSASVKTLADLRVELEKVELKLKALEDQKKKDGKISDKNAKEIERLKIAQQAYRKEINDVARATRNNAVSAAEKYTGTLKGLRAELSAAKDALAGIVPDTDAWRKQVQIVKDLNDRVSKAEQSYGVFTRNVGNYSSAFNGLGVSIQQVARELPSLSMGINQFVLAISNNLPILADNIKIAREEYKMMIAQGQSATPVWKQMLKSIVSWQTAMVVGITVLSTYGKDIVAAVSNLFKQKEAFDASAQAASDYHKTIAKGRVDAQKEVVTLETMYEAATDASKGMDLRREAVKALQKEYPSYLGNMSEEEIMTGKAAGAYSALKDRLLEVAQTRAVMDRLTELSAAKVSAEYEALQKAQTAYDRAKVKRDAYIANANASGQMSGAGAAGVLFAAPSVREERKALEDAVKEFAEKYGVQGNSIAEVNRYIEQSLNKLKGSITTFNTEVTAEENEMGKIIEEVNTNLYDADVEAIERKKSLLTMRAQLEFRAAEELEAELFQIKQDAQRERLALDRENGKITAEEFEMALALLFVEEQEFEQKQLQSIEEHAKEMRNAMIELAGGLSMDAQIRNLEEQYRQAFETLKNDANMAADERAYYELMLTEQLAKRKQEIMANAEEQITTNIKEERQEQVATIEEYGRAVMDMVASFNDIFTSLSDAERQRAEENNEAQKDALKKRLDSGLISQKKYDKEVEKADKELAEKKARIAREEAMRERALSLVQIAWSTAEAIMNIWATASPFAAPALTAMASAMGAAQIAAVMAAPVPTARKGGAVAGRTHENGGVLMELENEERIVGAKPSKAFPELLNLISYIGKNASIPDTGYAARILGDGGSGSAGNINADVLAQKIGEQVGDVLRQAPIYLSLTELREEQEIMARVENSARM